MESEQETKYELRTRNRSRSVTPQSQVQLQNPEMQDSEHPYQLRSRSRERSMTPGEVTTSRRTFKKHSTMDSIVEQNNENILEKADTVILTKKSERRSERQKLKRQLTNGQAELKENFSGTKFENITGRITPKRMMTSDYSSEEGDREDVINRPVSAFEFYKQQGDYWNKFPKTDYTYSPTSTCRYEVAPGILARPNMSRRSLRSTDSTFFSNQTSKSQSSRETFNDNNTLNFNETHENLSNKVPQLLPNIRGSLNPDQYAIYKRTHVQQYTVRHESVYDSANENVINERYESWAKPLSNNCRLPGLADSDTEFDETLSTLNSKQFLRNTQRVNKFTTLISTCFLTILHLLTLNKFKKQEISTSHYLQHKESKWSKFQQFFTVIIKQMYILLVKILLLDSWLLSRASNIRERAQGRRPKILLLLFLLLVFTIGTFIAQMNFFTRLDYLRNVGNNVTESINNFHQLTSHLIDYELYFKYLSTLKNMSLSNLYDTQKFFSSVENSE